MKFGASTAWRSKSKDEPAESSSTEMLADRMRPGSDEVVVETNRDDSTASVGGIPAGTYEEAVDSCTQRDRP